MLIVLLVLGALLGVPASVETSLLEDAILGAVKIDFSIYGRNDDLFLVILTDDGYKLCDGRISGKAPLDGLVCSFDPRMMSTPRISIVATVYSITKKEIVWQETAEFPNPNFGKGLATRSPSAALMSVVRSLKANKAALAAGILASAGGYGVLAVFKNKTKKTAVVGAGQSPKPPPKPSPRPPPKPLPKPSPKPAPKSQPKTVTKPVSQSVPKPPASKPLIKKPNVPKPFLKPASVPGIKPAHVQTESVSKSAGTSQKSASWFPFSLKPGFKAQPTKSMTKQKSSVPKTERTHWPSFSLFSTKVDKSPSSASKTSTILKKKLNGIRSAPGTIAVPHVNLQVFLEPTKKSLRAVSSKLQESAQYMKRRVKRLGSEIIILKDYLSTLYPMVWRRPLNLLLMTIGLLLIAASGKQSPQPQPKRRFFEPLRVSQTRRDVSYVLLDEPGSPPSIPNYWPTIHGCVRDFLGQAWSKVSHLDDRHKRRWVVSSVVLVIQTIFLATKQKLDLRFMSSRLRQPPLKPIVPTKF